MVPQLLLHYGPDTMKPKKRSSKTINDKESDKSSERDRDPVALGKIRTFAQNPI